MVKGPTCCWMEINCLQAHKLFFIQLSKASKVNYNDRQSLIVILGVLGIGLEHIDICYHRYHYWKCIGLKVYQEWLHQLPKFLAET